MSDLLGVVRTELALVDEFAALLSEEQAALESRASDALPAFAEKKSPLISRLNAQGALRNHLLQQEGLPEDRAGMTAWITKNPTAHAVRTAWENLIQRATAARESNELNSRLLAQQLQTTTEALGILRQEVRRQSLYGADGQPSGLTGNRVIDSA